MDTIDILVHDVPKEHYERVRKDLVAKGYYVQGFQKGYCQQSGKEVKE